MNKHLVCVCKYDCGSYSRHVENVLHAGDSSWVITNKFSRVRVLFFLNSMVSGHPLSLVMLQPTRIYKPQVIVWCVRCFIWLDKTEYNMQIGPYRRKEEGNTPLNGLHCLKMSERFFDSLLKQPKAQKALSIGPVLG